MTDARTHPPGGGGQGTHPPHPLPVGRGSPTLEKGVWGALGPKKGSDGRATVWRGDMHTRVEEGAAFQKARPPD